MNKSKKTCAPNLLRPQNHYCKNQNRRPIWDSFSVSELACFLEMNPYNNIRKAIQLLKQENINKLVESKAQKKSVNNVRHVCFKELSLLFLVKKKKKKPRKILDRQQMNERECFQRALSSQAVNAMISHHIPTIHYGSKQNHADSTTEKSQLQFEKITLIKARAKPKLKPSR